MIAYYSDGIIGLRAKDVLSDRLTKDLYADIILS